MKYSRLKEAMMKDVFLHPESIDLNSLVSGSKVYDPGWYYFYDQTGDTGIDFDKTFTNSNLEGPFISQQDATQALNEKLLQSFGISSSFKKASYERCPYCGSDSYEHQDLINTCYVCGQEFQSTYPDAVASLKKKSDNYEVKNRNGYDIIINQEGFMNWSWSIPELGVSGNAPSGAEANVAAFEAVNYNPFDEMVNQLSTIGALKKKANSELWTGTPEGYDALRDYTYSAGDKVQHVLNGDYGVVTEAFENSDYVSVQWDDGTYSGMVDTYLLKNLNNTTASLKKASPQIGDRYKIPGYRRIDNTDLEGTIISIDTSGPKTVYQIQYDNGYVDWLNDDSFEGQGGYGSEVVQASLNKKSLLGDPVFKIIGLSDYLDNQEYSLSHRLFQNEISSEDKSLVESLQIGDQTLITVPKTGATLTVERIASINKKAEDFDTWFDRFMEEKELDGAYQSWELTDSMGMVHYIDSDVVIEAIKSSPSYEKEGIKNMLVQIDFANGNVFDYLKHLAQALINNY